MRRALGYGLFSDNYAQGNRPHSSQIIEKIAQDTNFHAERFAANLHHNVIYIILPILHPHRGVFPFPQRKTLLIPKHASIPRPSPTPTKNPVSFEAGVFASNSLTVVTANSGSISANL